MARTTEGRLAYANLLRVLATLAIILFFTAAYWNDWAETTFQHNTFLTYQALTIWAFPMFAMLSGAFLLDPKKSIRLRDVFLRYILRVVIALVVWGIIFALLDCREFSWAHIKAAFTNTLWMSSKYHLRYLPILIGLYLVTPILRAFIRGASRGDLHWFFLLVFVFASLLPNLELWTDSRLLAVWTNLLDVHLVLGYVGYYVAGYYLKNYTIGRVPEFLIYILGILGIVSIVLSVRTGSYTGLLLNDHAPHMIFITIAVFVLFRYVLGVSDERSRRQRLGGVSKITFGIYLIHPLFFMLLDLLKINTMSFTPVLAIPALGGMVFLCSFIAAWLLSKIPFIGRWIT